eukprot:TRINITY_DN1431_c0_g1_i2.p1 TRINITY_DN1431_c0_g1~~TRINITY_DN1431_c0_g1_i2.p1  ORF type:complete len:180 (-),score=30.56 TRINITY_DN1431_c0_g1_i2:518-1036(-)
MAETQFLQDVHNGLSDTPKHISSKYLYDEIGDELFIKIMGCDDYYLTRAEDDIFKNLASDIVTSFNLEKNVHFDLIELGAGDGTKTLRLLEVLVEEGYNFSYLPVDISENVLEKLETMISLKLPSAEIRKQVGDYFQILEQLSQSNVKKVVFFLGSNIGTTLFNTFPRKMYN